MIEFLKLSDNYEINEFHLFGKDAEFHHFGVILKDSNSKPYIKLKYINDPIQNVKVGFYKLNNIVFEVVLPNDTNSPISKALENKNFYHHICYAVPNINEALEYASVYGVRRISKIVPAIAFSNRLICWCIGKNFGLMELIQT